MDCEVDLEVLHELYTALEETLEDADDRLVTPALLEGCFSKIELQVKRLLASRQERLEAKADADMDEEDLELLDEAEEQEEELLQQVRGHSRRCAALSAALPRRARVHRGQPLTAHSAPCTSPHCTPLHCMAAQPLRAPVHTLQVAAAIGSFLKRLGDSALPSVEKLMQEYLNPLLLDPSRRPEDRWVPLLVVSDCIEYAPSSSKHLAAVLPQLVANAQSRKPELVQVCVYTLGVVAEKHPSVRPHATLPLHCPW
jgi:Importin repeat 6